MLNPSAKHVFSLLQGSWSLIRTIAGHGTMKGTANLQKTENTQLFAQNLLYREDGIFELNDGKKLETHKEYLYILQNDKLGVYFVENRRQGRLFHILDFNKNETKNFLLAKAIHYCHEDIYNVRYKIYTNNHFQITYMVNGPKKNYISQTVFKRIN